MYRDFPGSAIEADSLASLVSQRVDLELVMRQILELQLRLSQVLHISTYLLTLVSTYLLQLTPDSPDYTDGKLVAVTLTELQVGWLHYSGCWVMARCCRRGYPSSTGRTSCSEDSRSWTTSWTPVSPSWWIRTICR